MVKSFPFRLDKPTGEALFAGDGANYKSSAPAGQASKWALGSVLKLNYLKGKANSICYVAIKCASLEKRKVSPCQTCWLDVPEVRAAVTRLTPTQDSNIEEDREDRAIQISLTAHWKHSTSKTGWPRWSASHWFAPTCGSDCDLATAKSTCGWDD